MNSEERPKAVFVLSTGRCGTMTLAHLLNLSPDIECHHEPSPRLIVESKRAYEGSPCAGEIFSACRIDLITEVLEKGLIYGECANRSTFFAPHIDRFFRGSVKFIHLVREVDTFVESALKRDWYNGNPWDIGRISPREGWHGETQRQKITWLWRETNRFIEDFLKSLAPERKHRLVFQYLTSGNMDHIKEVFSFIGVEPPHEEKLRRILKMQLNASIDLSGISSKSQVVTSAKEDPAPAALGVQSKEGNRGRSKPVVFHKEPVDICVITFSSNETNDHFDLIRNCLESILSNTDPAKFRLHIGCNNPSSRTLEFIDRLVSQHGATKYLGVPHRDAKGAVVFPKYPLMRRMYTSTHGNWVIWFDDDIYVTEKDWLDRLEDTINRHPDADQFGKIAHIALPHSIKEEWIDKAAWSRPGKIQYQEMPEGKMIVSPFVLGGFYALSRRAIRSCHIPDERLFHNFGDWTTGMALLHNGFQIAPFSYGIVFGDAPRRGIHEDLAVESDIEMVLAAKEQNGGKVYEWHEVPASEKPTAEPAAFTNPSFPDEFSLKTLEKNLDALMCRNPDLVRRLCLPVDGSHVQFLPEGRVMYEWNRNLIPFGITEDQVSSTIVLPPQGRDIFIFGTGLGEQLDYILTHCQNHKIILWDRDPWLLRLLLMRKDYSSLLRTAQVRAALGADLLEWMNGGERPYVVAHPLLKSIYETEYLLFQGGLSRKRAILCSGGLFIDDVSQALRESGYSLFSVDLKRLSREEIAGTMRRFDPQFLFAVNYINGLSELCQELGVPWICWEIDPAADHIKPLASPCVSGNVFTYRRANTAEFEKAGFTRVEYLPLAANPKRRSPSQLSSDERPRYEADLSFVGSSMISQATSFRNLLLQKYKDFRGGDPAAIQEGNTLLEQVLLLQRQNPAVYQIPQLLKEHCPDFLRHLLQSPASHDPYMLLAEIAAAEKRVNTIVSLAPFNIKVWGDEGWKMTERFGVKYMGKAGHDREINKIYGASLINVDINRIYQPDIVTMRVFDIMACGGFVLAEYSPALEELFAIGNEVETYHTINELLSKAAFYLEHRDRVREIAAAGREAVLKRHTIQTRVAHMLHSGGFVEGEGNLKKWGVTFPTAPATCALGRTGWSCLKE